MNAGASVIQQHGDGMRSGVYIDAALTHAAMSTFHRDQSFSVNLDGPTYAQPLYLDGAFGGADGVLVATEQNVVAVFNASTGAQIWKVTLATPVALNDLPCGNINPLGITGTPYVDLAARTVYLGAMTTPDNGSSKKHQLFALDLDTGATKSGWPIDIETALSGHNPAFQSQYQNQRGALAFVNGVLYVPYGGHYGDCGTYYGWVIGVDTAHGNTVTAFNTAAKGGGIWNPSGISNDGQHLFVATGNSFNANTWGGGDGIYRLGAGPSWSTNQPDYWAPNNWQNLDAQDLDMGTALPFDAPGVTPSALVAGFGKDGNLYLMDRSNLAGIGGELTSQNIANSELNGAATAYTSGAGTFLVNRIDGNNGGANCTNSGTGNLVAVKITSGPTINASWCGTHFGLSVPSTSMTAPGMNPIVWTFSGTKLYGYDGETGAELFNGGASTDAMTGGTSYFSTPVIAKGKVWVAAKSHLYVFTP